MTDFYWPQAYVQELYKEVHKKNKISGHEWMEWGDFICYEVCGIGYPRKRFKSLEKAQAYADDHNALGESIRKKIESGEIK